MPHHLAFLWRRGGGALLSVSTQSQSEPLTIEAGVASPRARTWPDYLIVTVAAALLSCTAFLHYWRSGELLLYGDAVAHMNIARRVVDTRLPGLFQFGTVWLPLPHILMIPLIRSTWIWQTGVGGAIPSMLAYILGVIGIFRLVRTGLNQRPHSRLAAYVATAIFAVNPNLLYLQSTAMTEVLYLALFVWATVYLTDFGLALSSGNDRRAQRSLIACAIVLVLAMLTRYDGWFITGAYSIAALALLIHANRRNQLPGFQFLYQRSWRRVIVGIVLMLALVPAWWFIYNQREFHDYLAFVRGPYSAKGIEARTQRPGQPHHPGWNSPTVGATYFVKSAKLNMASTDRSQRMWIYAAVLGSIYLLGFMRPLLPWLLLWAPVPFYAISMAWGGVPIFIPVWWPFSYYNVRYGTQLIPVFAVFGALLVLLVLNRFRWRVLQYATIVAAAILISTSYYGLVREVPICLREARVNSVDRIALEKKLSAELRQLPANSTLLMYLGQHGGALQDIGFPLRRTINECHKRYWESALMAPALSADYIIATQGDPISEAIRRHPAGIEKIAEISVPRQSPISIYRSTDHR